MEFPSTAADVSGQSMQLGPFLMNVIEIHAGFRYDRLTLSIMKTKLGRTAVVITALFSAINSSGALAPSSIAGDGFLVTVTDGIYPFADYGYYLFIPANSGNTYQSIGVFNVVNSTGTYSSMPTSSSTATLNINDSVSGLESVAASFATSNSGSFYSTANSYPGAYQMGYFDFSSGNAPSSAVGKTILLTVYDSGYPFDYSDSFEFYTAPSGNTFTTSDGGSGTYSYSLVNQSTGKLVVNDVRVGAYTAYVGFTDPLNGGYAVTQPSTGGFQIGTFMMFDTVPPTVTIKAPTVGQRWSNSVFTVTGRASDDVQVVAVYYHIIGQGWNLATTANGWSNWSGNINLSNPGTNIVQAYSLDSSGNSSPISSQIIVYVITAPITVHTNGNGTVSPNYNGQMLEVGKSYSMTATAATGFMFTNWTGSVPTNGATVKFIMASDLVLTANFVDIQKPTVSIANVAKTYTNSQTVTISATAADNVGVALVEFYDGAMYKGSDSTAAYTYEWPFTAADNGAHVWTARAYDAAGNSRTSSPVTLTVSIDITPPTVVISSPTNGVTRTTSPVTISGKASDPGSPSSGLARVEVRVNGGSWTNATGTASWTRSVALSPCGNTIETRSRDKAGNYSVVASIFVIYTPPNTVPNTPINVLPASGATGVSLTPTLQASAFSDPDCIGDTHAASQWQVLNSAGAVVVADSGTNAVNLTSWIVPTNKLYYGSNYQWRVRYRDSRNGWSSNSTPTTFITGGPLLIGTSLSTSMVFKWPTNAVGFTLQWSTNLGAANWSNAVLSPVIVSGQYTVTNSMTNDARFYRLRK
jgi:hypothetical protein